MRARLPTTAEQSQDLRLCGRQVFRAHRTHGGHAHFLNHAVRHDRDRLELLQIEQDHQAAPAAARGDRQYAPPLHAVRIREPGHVGSDAQGPDAAADATALLGLEPVLEAGVLLGFHRHIGLRARAVDGLPMRQLAQNRFGRGQSVLVCERLVDVLVTE